MACGARAPAEPHRGPPLSGARLARGPAIALAEPPAGRPPAAATGGHARAPKPLYFPWPARPRPVLRLDVRAAVHADAHREAGARRLDGDRGRRIPARRAARGRARTDRPTRMPAHLRVAD